MTEDQIRQILRTTIKSKATQWTDFLSALPVVISDAQEEKPAGYFYAPIKGGYDPLIYARIKYAMITSILTNVYNFISRKIELDVLIKSLQLGIFKNFYFSHYGNKFIEDLELLEKCFPEDAPTIAKILHAKTLLIGEKKKVNIEDKIHDNLIDNLFRKLSAIRDSIQKNELLLEIEKENDELIITFPNHRCYQVFCEMMGENNNNNSCKYRVPLTASDDQFYQQLTPQFIACLNKINIDISQTQNGYTITLPAIFESDTLMIVMSEKDLFFPHSTQILENPSVDEDTLVPTKKLDAIYNVQEKFAETARENFAKLAEKSRFFNLINNKINNEESTSNPLMKMLGRFLQAKLFEGDKEEQKKDFLNILTLFQVTIQTKTQDNLSADLRNIPVSTKISHELKAKESATPSYIAARKELFEAKVLLLPHYWDEFITYIKTIPVTGKGKDLLQNIHEIINNNTKPSLQALNKKLEPRK